MIDPTKIKQIEGATYYVTAEPTPEEILQFPLPVNFKIVDVESGTFKLISYKADGSRLLLEGDLKIGFAADGTLANDLDIPIPNVSKLGFSGLDFEYETDAENDVLLVKSKGTEGYFTYNEPNLLDYYIQSRIPYYKKTRADVYSHFRVKSESGMHDALAESISTEIADLYSQKVIDFMSDPDYVKFIFDLKSYSEKLQIQGGIAVTDVNDMPSAYDILNTNEDDFVKLHNWWFFINGQTIEDSIGTYNTIEELIINTIPGELPTNYLSPKNEDVGIRVTSQNINNSYDLITKQYLDNAISEIPEAIVYQEGLGIEITTAIGQDPEINVNVKLNNNIVSSEFSSYKNLLDGITTDFFDDNNVVVDSLNNMFILFKEGNNRNSAIIKITPEGVSSIIFSEIASLTANIVIDSNNNIFVAKRYSDVSGIIKITPDGSSSVFFLQNLGTSFIAIDGMDNIFITEQGVISKITPEGVSSIIYNEHSNEPFDFVNYNAYNGMFFISDYNRNRTLIMNNEGSILNEWAGIYREITSPDSENNYVFGVGSDASIIYKLYLNGVVELYYAYTYPISNIYLTPDGRLFFTAQINLIELRSDKTIIEQPIQGVQANLIAFIENDIFVSDRENKTMTHFVWKTYTNLVLNGDKIETTYIPKYIGGYNTDIDESNPEFPVINVFVKEYYKTTIKLANKIWIDEKPIYRVVFSGLSSESLPDISSYDIDTIISAIYTKDSTGTFNGNLILEYTKEVV